MMYFCIIFSEPSTSNKVQDAYKFDFVLQFQRVSGTLVQVCLGEISSRRLQRDLFGDVDAVYVNDGIRW